MALFVTTLTNGDDTLVFTGVDLFDIPWTINALAGNDSVTINGANITSGGGDYTICNLDDGDDYARVNGGFVVRVFGGNGNDSLDLYSKAFFDGGPGNDALNVFAGTSVGMDGGPGADTVNFNANISAGITGGDDDDVFRGNGHAITGGVSGGNGNDSFIDIATPSVGALILTGGAGNDLFMGTTGELNGIVISDFSPGDMLRFTNVSANTFQFSVSGNTLTYTGGSLTFGAPLAGTLTLHNLSGRVFLTLAPGTLAHVPQNDFNGDGRSDVLWRSDTGELTNWLGAGPGAFSGNGANAYTIVPTDWHIAGTGDFDGDGRDDILWRNDSGAITNWTANASGNGGFAASTTFSTTVSSAWHVVGVGDFNADTRDDILWRNDDGTITDWLSNANGTFSASSTFSTYVPTDWHVAGTGDFNGDGRDDILWRNDNGQLTDWLRTANGSFLSGVFSVYVPTDWSVAATGDFNGDGYTDVLWRQDTGQLTDWLGSPSGALVDNGANASIFVPASWQVVSVGDFNGDARDDILWRNSNGQLTEWLGSSNGGFTDNSANASTFVPTSWHVVSYDGGLH